MRTALQTAARTAIIAGMVSACLAGMALAQTAPATTGDTSKGKALVNGKGMTLYTFDRDSSSKSNCNGHCAQLWDPLPAAADAKPSGSWTIITREDGSKQWAYKGHPLYAWSKDKKPGDVTGDGVNSVWHIASP
jgi:predicted lipoprotein with Yx(FWY)xxD motif